MTGLHRHECSECGEVVINDEIHMDDCPSCDEKYAVMANKPAPEHDKEIMEEPSDSMACPECGVKMAATATEDGKDWKCRRGAGGCGFALWRATEGKEAGIPAPEDFSEEEHARQNAWSRYQRYQAGHFEYRD